MDSEVGLRPLNGDNTSKTVQKLNCNCTVGTVFKGISLTVTIILIFFVILKLILLIAAPIEPKSVKTEETIKTVDKVTLLLEALNKAVNVLNPAAPHFLPLLDQVNNTVNVTIIKSIQREIRNVQ